MNIEEIMYKKVILTKLIKKTFKYDIIKKRKGGDINIKR